MYRRPDIVNWAVLAIFSIGVASYLIFFANIVGKEQEDIARAYTSAGALGTSTQSITKNNTQEKKSMNTAFITTNFGTIELELYSTDAPKTIENFVKLAQTGFYDGVRFHRVIPNFMIQGGDPLSKDLAMQARWGTGGPGYQFADEINAGSALYKTGYKRGVLAMANSGPNTNGSQFFIMHKDYPLPPNYTIFGRVVNGIETVDKIASNPTDPNDRPIKEVVMIKIEVK